MKKRFLFGICTLVCMMVLVFLIPTSAEAAICKHTYVDTVCTACGKIGGTCGAKATWNFEPETGILRIGGSGNMTNYSADVPAPWFIYRQEIKEVVMGASVTSIGSYAFNECTEMTTINIPKSVTNIYTQSFYKCYSLEEFVLDEKCNYSLDDKGVLYNKKYTYLIALPGVFEGVCEIPATVTTVGPGSSEPSAFSHIKGVTQILVDEGNTKYSNTEEGLLCNKEQTKVIVCPRSYEGICTLPATVTSYASDAFTDCYGLAGIFVEEGNTKYSSTPSGLLCNLAGTSVTLCPAGFKGTCVIPAKITSCPISAFSQSVGLEKFEVEEGNTKYSSDEAGMLFNKAGTKLLICPNAYKGDYELPAGVTSVAADAFQYAPGMTGFKVPEESTRYTVDEYGVLYTKDMSALISCPPSFQGTYVVPDTVVTLGNNAFYNCLGLTAITIPDTITTIGDYCFYKCTNLANVPMPSGLKKIGTHAFAHCPNQTDADIPDTVTSIGTYAFAYCPGVLSASIPEGITSITGLFMGCPNLISVNLPGTLTTIGDKCFYECSALTEINVPDTVTSIGNSCFWKCENMPNIPIPSGLTSLGSKAFGYCHNQTDAVLPVTVTGVGDNAFEYCTGLAAAVIPEGIVSLKGVFRDCTNLTSVSLPGTIETLGDYTFNNCVMLEDIVIPDTTTKIGNYCFYKCEKMPDVAIPSGLTQLGNYAFAYCRNQTSADIPETVTSLGQYAFAGCSSLKTATIPWGIETLSNSIFRECTKLESVTIPDTVTVIGDNCFYKCTNLVKADIPAGVTKIGGSAFYQCSKLENLWIPDGVVEIGASAFSYCDKLTDVVIPAGVTRIENSTFNECENLVNVTLHDNITYIGNSAFYDCKKLNPFSLPANLEEIGTSAFWFCSRFEEFVIPESVTKIGSSAFRYCENLKRIVVPGTVESLGGYLFYGSENLTDVTLGEGLTEISDYMFYSCKQLEEVKIPESVARIGVCAFKYCEALPEIKIPDQVTGIEMLAFEDCIALKNVELPANLTAMGESVFRNSGLNRVKIPNGVTMLNVLSFGDCPDLKVVEIPGTVTAILDAAFMNSGITDVIYYGTEGQWSNIFVGAENGAVENALMHFDPEAKDSHEITVEEVELSCTVSGGTYRTCTCGIKEILNEQPAQGHMEVFVDEVGEKHTQTELVAGVAAHYQCSLCEKYFTTDKVETTLEALTGTQPVHTYSSWKTNADRHWKECDCGRKSENALHSYDNDADTTCEPCGYIRSLPHTHGSGVKQNGQAASCTVDGWKDYYKCSCGKFYTESACTNEIVDFSAWKSGEGKIKASHNYGVLISAVTEKHTQTELAASVAAHYHCSVCGKYFTSGKAETTLKELTGTKPTHIYDNNVDGTCNVCGVNRAEVESRKVVHMFRMYNPNTGEHFYTGSTEERDNLIAAGWQYEGVGFTFPANTGDPVHRLFHEPTGEHLYTMNAAEKDALIAAGWNYEGIAFNSAYDTEAVQYRLHNPNASCGAYHFTFSLEERQTLLDAGWEDQGIGWYSCWK